MVSSPFVSGRRPAARLALPFAALLALAGCDGSTPSADTPRAEAPSTVVIANGVDLQSVNEVIARNTALHTDLHYYMLFMPLLEEQGDYQEGPPTWKPRLASDYVFSEDRRQLTFHLRPDAQWSDGAPITAEDVRFTWQAQVDPDVGWLAADIKAPILDVEVVDPHTVRFHYAEPYATQLIDAVSGVILPKHAWSELPFDQWRDNNQWFFDHLVVSGPFILERWQPQERFILIRNPRYYPEDMPSIERVVVEVVPEQGTQMAMMRSGKANFMQASADLAAGIEANPALDLIAYPYRQYVFVSWNCARPPFDDRRVRRALTMAIDRQQIIDTLYFGYASLAISPYTVDSWVYDRDRQPLPFDPAAAQTLLTEAGWVDGDGDGVRERDGRPLRFELLTNNDNQLRMDIMVMIQEQLKRIGVEVKATAIEFNTLVEREFAHDYDASIASLGIDTSLDLSATFHSKSIDGSLNWGSYRNPEVDRLLDEISAQLDPLQARPLYLRLQALLQEDQPLTILYQPMRLVATRGLRNVQPNPLSMYFNIRDWQLTGAP